jgi:photosystem II stability/assembly factor-like uncharacterized protein
MRVVFCGYGRFDRAFFRAFALALAFLCMTGLAPEQTFAQNAALYRRVLTGSVETVRDREGAATSQPYADNQNAFWLIRPASRLGVRCIALRFENLNTQRNADFVRIFVGGAPNVLDTSRLVATYSGDQIPPTLFVEANAVTVQFITNEAIAGESRHDSASGWTLRSVALADKFTDAEGVFADRADISSPYANNLDALWLIRPAGARQIFVQFDSLNIEEDYDFVTIIAGLEEPRIVGRFSGSTLPPALAVNDSAVLLRFTSDASVSGDDETRPSGWRLRYTSFSRPTELRPDIDLIDAGVTNLGEISSTFSFRLSGFAFLDDIVITAPEGFLVSSTATGAFTQSLTINVPKFSTDVFRTQIFLRFSPQSSGEYLSRLLIRSGAANEGVDLRGVCRPPIFWESTGGPYSGQISAIAVAPGNVLLAGTRSGVYRSTSNGAVWLSSSAGLQGKDALNVRHIAVAEDARRIVTTFLTTAGGLFVSADTGKTWNALPTTGLPRRATAYQMLAFGARLFVATDYGAYRFVALSRQWVRAMDGFPKNDVDVRALALHEGNIVAGTYGYGAYISADSGASWRAMNGGVLPDNDDEAFAVKGFVSAGGRLWAIVDSLVYDEFYDYEYPEYSLLYSTRSNGLEWRKENIDDLYLAKLDVVYSAVLVKNMLFLGTDGGVVRKKIALNASGEDETTWTIPRDPRASGFIEPTALALARNGATLYAGTYGGMFRSSSEGVSWQAINTGITATRIYTMEESRGSFLVGSEGSGAFRTSDNGATWQSANAGLRGVFIGAFAKTNEGLYLCSYNDRSTPDWRNNGVYRSLDNGVTWRQTSPFPRSNTQATVQFPQPDALSITADERNTLFVGGVIGDSAYFYSSTTGGVSWRRIPLPSIASTSYIYDVSAFPSLGVFIGTYGKAVFWLPDPYAPTPQWRQITFEDNSNDEDFVRCFAYFRNNLYVGTDGGLHRLNGARTRWLRLQTQATVVQNQPILSLLVKGGFLYAGVLGSGVWRSVDGVRWEQINEGFFLNNPNVYSLGSDDNYLYAGLDGNAVFRAPLNQPATRARAFVQIGDWHKGKPGDTVAIPLRLGARQNIPALAPEQMPVVSGVLRFNASLLEPIDEETRLQSVVLNGERLVNFRAPLKSDAQIAMTGDSTLRVFRFRALLGNSVATPLTLTNLSAPGVTVLVRDPGLFSLEGLSNAGGTRLFVADARPTLAVQPNPAADVVQLSLKTFEDGQTTLALINVFGQTVRTLFSGALERGEYEIAASLAETPQGTYFVRVQTPTQQVVQQIHVLR